jgi:hypothetical protein
MECIRANRRNYPVRAAFAQSSIHPLRTVWNQEYVRPYYHSPSKKLGNCYRVGKLPNGDV